MRNPSVQAFELDLEGNLFSLRDQLLTGYWQPEPYEAFYIRDPKPRHIHKASVRDRVLYQAVFRVLEPLFDPSFIHDSYSCRTGKGTHRGVFQLERYLRKASGNYSHPAYALKCDVRRFFDSVSHKVLLGLIRRRVKDARMIALVEQVIASFKVASGRGLPLGNVTSQLFANVYLNELDQFVKRELKVRWYLRYCDDFVMLDESPEYLTALLPYIHDFLSKSLGLDLHPDKILLRKFSHGIDFLGYIVLPHYRILRASTRRRMFRKLARTNVSALSLQSYLGLLKHAKAYKLEKRVIQISRS